MFSPVFLSRFAMSSLHSEAQLAKVFQAAVDFAMMADLLATLATALCSPSAAEATAPAASPSAAASSSASSSAPAPPAATGSAPDAASVESSLSALNISESASASATAAPSAEHQSAAVALRNSAYFVLKSLPLSKRFAFTFSCLGAAEKQHAESIFAALTHSVGAPADRSAGIAFAASDLETLHACYK
jgi:hypothetical protein